MIVKIYCDDNYTIKFDRSYEDAMYGLFDIFEKIVLVDDDVEIDVITPHMLKVFYDCYTHDKSIFQSFRNQHREVAFNRKTYSCVMIPIQFFFNEQKNIELNGNKHKVLFYPSADFLNCNKNNDTIRLALNIKGDVRRKNEIIPRQSATIFPFTFDTPTSHVMSYSMSHLCFRPANGYKHRVCKYVWFSIVNRKTREYVTSDAVDRLYVTCGMTIVTSMSIKDATIISHMQHCIIPSENHIYIKYGSDDDDIGLPMGDIQINFIFNPSFDISNIHVECFGKFADI